MPGTFSPPSRVSDPDMYHGTCVTHVTRCMPGSLFSGFLRSWWRGKTFPAFPAHAQPAIYLSGKRPMTRCFSCQSWILDGILPSITLEGGSEPRPGAVVHGQCSNCHGNQIVKTTLIRNMQWCCGVQLGGPIVKTNMGTNSQFWTITYCHQNKINLILICFKLDKIVILGIIYQQHECIYHVYKLDKTPGKNLLVIYNIHNLRWLPYCSFCTHEWRGQLILGCVCIYVYIYMYVSYFYTLSMITWHW